MPQCHRTHRDARVWLVLPHDGLVFVELFARGAHDAILLAADVAAVRRLDRHLRVGAELEDERLWRRLACADTAVTLQSPVLAVVTFAQTTNSNIMSCCVV